MHIVQEIEREHIIRAALQLLQDNADFIRNCTVRDSLFNPGIHAESDKLSFKYRRCFEKNLGRRNVACNHFQRIGIEIQIVRFCICNSQGQSIPILTSGTSSTLQELALRRRHAAQYNSRQVANVNTHFQSRRAGQYVWIPKLLRIFTTLKVSFKLLSIWALQQTCMLSRVDTHKISSAIKTTVIINFSGFVFLQETATSGALTRRTIPKLCIFS